MSLAPAGLPAARSARGISRCGDTFCRILIACCGVPGTGGGSTCAYALYRALLEDGLPVRYLSLVERRDVPYYTHLSGIHFANPESLPGAGCCLLESAPAASHPELDAALDEIAPEVILAVGDQTAIRMAGRGAGAPVVLYLTGADEPEGHRALVPEPGLAAAVRAARTGPLRRPHPCWPPQAVKSAYLIVAPSAAARQVYVASFPSYTGKIHPRPVWPAEWIARDVERWSGLRRPWGERDIDAILVANRWSRPLKNFRLACRLASRSRDLSIVVVGEGQRRCPGARSVGLVPARADYLALLGRAKALVCPSTFEASATPLYEAAAMGCNVVASPDCGGIELCDGDLVCAPDDASSFAERLGLAVAVPRETGLEGLSRAGSYADLLETLEVVARD